MFVQEERRGRGGNPKRTKAGRGREENDPSDEGVIPQEIEFARDQFLEKMREVKRKGIEVLWLSQNMDIPLPYQTLRANINFGRKMIERKTGKIYRWMAGRTRQEVIEEIIGKHGPVDHIVPDDQTNKRLLRSGKKKPFPGSGTDDEEDLVHQFSLL